MLRTRSTVITACAIAAFSIALGVTAVMATQRNTQTVPADEYDFPAFSDLRTSVDNEEIESLQVVQKARKVGLATHNIPALSQTEEALVSDLESHFAESRAWHTEAVFTGTTAQELQEFLDASPDALVHIEASSLTLDQTIYLHNDTHLDANGARITCSFDGPAFRIEDAANVSIDHALITGTSSIGILVHNSSFVRIQDSTFRDFDGKPIVVSGDTTYFRIAESTFTRCTQGGIMVSGDASYGLVEANSITDNMGYSNWMAGIVVTNLAPEDPANIWEAFPDNPPHFAARDTLADVPVSAHNIVVRGNQVSGNQSSGIYCDGVYNCFIFDNHVFSNDKEGMCLDYGTLSCRVHNNEFAGNGRRIRQDNRALELDGMLEYGRLEDDSAAAKLPGISLDNAAYNIVEFNQVHDNWGGGIKAVCCAVRNVIANNTITNNNLGENDVFYFTGIELGNAQADPSPDMDHAPCFQNIVVHNRITGNHYAGVLISNEGTGNYVNRNDIEDQKRFAIMSGSKRYNDISDNKFSGFVIDRSVIPI